MRSQPADIPVARVLIGVRPAERLLSGLRLDASSGQGRPSRTAIAFSPDGRSLVFSAEREGRVQLYLRRLDQLEATAIPGTEGASSPFFSPDGQSLGFHADGALKKVPLNGGPVRRTLQGRPRLRRQLGPFGPDRVCSAERRALAGLGCRWHADCRDKAETTAKSVIGYLSSSRMGTPCCPRSLRAVFHHGTTPSWWRSRSPPASGGS